MVGTRCRQRTAEMGCCLLRIQIVLYFIPLISEGYSLLPHSTEKGCVEDGCCVVVRHEAGVVVRATNCRCALISCRHVIATQCFSSSLLRMRDVVCSRRVCVCARVERDRCGEFDSISI